MGGDIKEGGGSHWIGAEKKKVVFGGNFWESGKGISLSSKVVLKLRVSAKKKGRGGGGGGKKTHPLILMEGTSNGRGGEERGPVVAKVERGFLVLEKGMVWSSNVKD